MSVTQLTIPVAAQLVALDLDGTVLAPNGHVTPRTRDAIRALVASGIRACIATGRTWSESRHVIAETGLTGPGVFAGGAVINEMATGERLASTHVAGDLARAVCRILHAAGQAAMVYQAGAPAGDADWLVSAEHPMPPTVPEWFARFDSTFRRASGLDAADHAHTVRISTVASAAVGDALARRLVEALGDRVYLHQITVPPSGAQVLEVFDASVDKWRGLLSVAMLSDVDPRAILAVGDDVNDLPMLRNAAVGVAMGNATPLVRQLVKRTLGTNADDGLAAWLDEITACAGNLATLARGRGR